MPSSKSVRFEDLDDGVDDGLYGMKVCLLSSIRFPATPRSHQLLHTGQQGILKNLYTQAGSYRKWARSHSKKVCVLSCCVISLRSSQTLIMHGPLCPPSFLPPHVQILSWGISLAWYFTMASILTVIPLSLELQREQSVVEMEKIQVKELLAQGYPPQELQRMGMTLEPAVLNERQ